jgi:hypothetical protein
MAGGAELRARSARGHMVDGAGRSAPGHGGRAAARELGLPAMAGGLRRFTRGSSVPAAMAGGCDAPGF